MYLNIARDRRGFTLESTILVMVLLTILIGFAASQTMRTIRTADLDYRAARAAYEAEGGADAVLGQLKGAMADGIVSPADLAAIVPPTLGGFTFQNVRGDTTGPAVVRTITDGPYAGLISLNQPIEVNVTAVDPNNNSTRIVLGINAQSVPVFQFGVFYDEDLEIHNGPRLDFSGWVHTNGNLYLRSNNSFFHSLITTPRQLVFNRKAADMGTPISGAERGVWIDNAASTSNALTFDSRSAPDTSNFKNLSDINFDGRVMTGVSGVKPLRLPLPAGMAAIQLIQPRNVADNADVQGVKFAWKADWMITVDLFRLNNICNGAMAHLRLAGPISSAAPADGTAQCNAIFQGIPNAFQEGRENIGPDVFQIDVAQLRAWIGVAAARQVRTMYVTFVNTNPAGTPAANWDYPVVRLRNASALPSAFTFATDRPLYVWGNYNSVGWSPSALAADAITFLSNGWVDPAAPPAARSWNPVWDPNVTHAYAKSAAAPTSVYAAIAAGHSATPCDVVVTSPCPALPPGSAPPTAPPQVAYANYGGGLENFPRFLEDWGGVQFTYRGSLVSLFQSAYAARRRWSWQDYYTPPNRDWQFDLRFQDPNNLPPSTPVVGNIFQTAFRTVY